MRRGRLQRGRDSRGRQPVAQHSAPGSHDHQHHGYGDERMLPVRAEGEMHP